MPVTTTDAAPQAQIDTDALALLVGVTASHHNLRDRSGMPYHVCPGDNCPTQRAIKVGTDAIRDAFLHAETAQKGGDVVGGKPSKGTPADKRIATNKPKKG